VGSASDRGRSTPAASAQHRVLYCSSAVLIASSHVLAGHGRISPCVNTHHRTVVHGVSARGGAGGARTHDRRIMRMPVHADCAFYLLLHLHSIMLKLHRLLQLPTLRVMTRVARVMTRVTSAGTTRDPGVPRFPLRPVELVEVRFGAEVTRSGQRVGPLVWPADGCQAGDPLPPPALPNRSCSFASGSQWTSLRS
jgi:hypothetical protein